MKTGNILADFEWKRAADGYRWQEIAEGLYMIPRQDDGKPLRLITYNPFADGNAPMFLEFSAMERSPESCLSFANRYGQLGYPLTMQNIANWGLDRLPVLEAENTWIPAEPNYRGPVGEFYEYEDDRWENASWSDQMLGMSLALEHASTDDGINAFTSQMFFNVGLKDGVSMFMSHRKEGRGFDLKLKPVSLVGGLWLQAAIAVSSEKSFRQCAVCHGPLEIARGGGARTDARFCSDACKSKDHRQRRKKARALAEAKKSASQIAKQLGTNVETVRRWIE